MNLTTWRLLGAAGISVLISAGCADLKEELPPSAGPGLSVHPAGWAVEGSADFHGNTIRSAGWDMRSCQKCHGAAYTGGTSEVSCRICHTGDAGPEGCTTCHGGAANAAPPRDVGGGGIGAHQRHYVGGGRYSSGTVACSGCHSLPDAVYVPGHVDSPLPAEVALTAPLATADPTGVSGPPAYSPGTRTCGNTFCHGNFSLRRSASPYDFIYTDSVMTGRNHSPGWGGGAADAECGTCHAIPPAGHVAAAVSECSGCHEGVINASGTITDKTKHMNGKINVFGEERPFF